MLDWIMMIILIALLCGVPSLFLEGLREYFAQLKAIREGGEKTINPMKELMSNQMPWQAQNIKMAKKRRLISGTFGPRPDSSTGMTKNT